MKKAIYFSILLCAAIAFSAIARERVLQFYSNGKVINTYPIEQIDYLEVTETLSAPANLTATTNKEGVLISWEYAEAATFNIYRSADGVNFLPLARDISDKSYTDKTPILPVSYYKVEASAEGLVSAMSTAAICNTQNAGKAETGLYLGIMGFNYKTYPYPTTILSPQSRPNADAFINSLSCDNQTRLYHTFGEAITTLQSTELPDNLMNVAIVTFTDGLDMGSLGLDGVDYENNAEYSAALNERIKTEKVGGLPITAYTIGVMGNDVTNVNEFRSNLQMLASSPENAFEVSNMSEVNTIFQQIAEELNSSFNVQNISIKIQKISNGSSIRFTFDNVSNPLNSECYIEGTFNLKEGAIENITYHGMTSSSEKKAVGVVDERNELTFTFKDIMTDNNKVISPEFIDEWYTSSGNWQINSEFVKDRDAWVETESRSAAIMLLLDCSSSLKNDFATIQANAKAFIHTLCPEAETPGQGSSGSSSTVYSTTPLDLSLAVSINGTRYYLTKEQYDKANLSNAIIEGVTVLQGEEKFIIALEDAPTNSVYWSFAHDFYESVLPTYAQGQIISARYSMINNAITSFGGISLGRRWVNAEYNSSYAYYFSDGGGSLDASSSSLYIRPVKAINAPSPIQWNHNDDLKLAVKKDGVISYLSNDEYKAMSPELDSYEILGVRVICGTEDFIIALQNVNADAMYWSVATSLYGDVMPTHAQGRAISGRYPMINQAIKAFGGTSLGSHWVNKEYNSSYAYYFLDENGDLNTYSSKLTVRPVIPTPAKEPTK